MTKSENIDKARLKLEKGAINVAFRKLKSMNTNRKIRARGAAWTQLPESAPAF